MEKELENKFLSELEGMDPKTLKKYKSILSAEIVK